MLRNKILMVFLSVFVLAVAAMAAELPANSKPVEITAGQNGVMTYNTKTDIATIDGDVKIVQGDAVITGKHVEYNQKTMNGKITGGVTAIKDKSTLTCNEAELFKQEQLVALGNVIATGQGYRFNSERLEYYVQTGRVFAPLASVITSKDGIMHAGQIEYFTKSAQGKAWNGVRIDSPARNIVATSQTATYAGGDNAIVTLSGKAHAVQNGNVLDGDELKYFMKENCFVADGNTKVIYYPNSSESGH